MKGYPKKYTKFSCLVKGPIHDPNVAAPPKIKTQQEWRHVNGMETEVLIQGLTLGSR